MISESNAFWRKLRTLFGRADRSDVGSQFQDAPAIAPAIARFPSALITLCVAVIITAQSGWIDSLAD
jgi:hypothetical protein